MATTWQVVLLSKVQSQVTLLA
ncbi:hypothetical protein CCACVL1_16526 [Corchorus capsularis]|uniref:Uncharacterized protein n=1 Tax=Corchorus capsularis TaxID=210143 RepID=A0A1R3HWG7_COCAP|nr:hypothetical protein CCACVL1_16526 [Corchorus capsularis]